MTQYPRKDGDARTGSNVRGEPLLAHRRKEIARETRPLERLAKDYHRQSRTLLSKADLRRAAKMGRDANREWREASIAAKGDSSRIDALKRTARSKLERRLARELGGYRQWRTIQKAHLRAQSQALRAALTARRFPQVLIDWGCAPPFDPGPSQTFVAPFTTFDVQMIDLGGFVVEDNSFAKPGIGHLVNNFAFDQDESTSIGAGLLGILPIANATSMVSCGVGFTVPSAGRLKVGAVLRNLYNKLVFSVEDKFGRSSAGVWASVRFLVAVVRGSREVEFVTKDLQSTHLSSGGGDIHYAQSDLDTTTPYCVSVETSTRYDANESVLVLAGSEVFLGTELDDMHCKLNAVVWWQLQTLVIDHAVDVIL